MKKAMFWVMRGIYTLSLIFFMLLSMRNLFGSIGVACSLVLTLVCGWVIAPTVIENIAKQKNVGQIAVALIFAVYVTLEYAKLGNGIATLYLNPTIAGFLEQINLNMSLFGAMLKLLPIPATFMNAYWLLGWLMPKIKSFFEEMDNTEKKFLVWGTLIGVLLIGIVFHSSSLFSNPHDLAGNLVEYDALYTTDTGDVVNTDCFFYIVASPNDLRQPLFGLFALPFSFVARIISLVLFMIPNAYIYILQLIQFVLLLITEIMLTRMMKIEGAERAAFWLFSFGTYTYMIYSFVVEQYIFAYFYVILTIYAARQCKRINYAYYGAVSTLLTSGVLFPLVTRSKDKKEWIKNLLKAFLGYMGLVTVCGQLPQFLNIRNQMQYYMQFSGQDVTWREKTIQFTQFVKNIFWAPQGMIENGCYHLAVAQRSSIVGILLLALCIGGFILNHEKYLAKVAFAWVLFSVAILYVVGWGTAENGLILYALYFAWAYIVLIYYLLQSIIKRVDWRRNFLLGIAAVSCAFNVLEVVHIVNWGMENYIR